MYYRDDGSGKTTNITFAMYERMPEKRRNSLGLEA